ncbi:MAG: Veg family protein [Monoglobales bacterium]
MGNKVEFIRKGIESRIGNRVRITTKEGRQKYITRKGVIENTYRDVFVVRFDQKADGESCRSAFSYIDVLTHDIDIAVYAPAL